MEPLPDPVQPTSKNIAKVKVNLTNMQRFNDLLYTYTLPKTTNAFLLLSKNDNNDPGMNVGINLLCGAIIGVGGEFGILGCVIANYYCGLISEFSETKPPSLINQYTNYSTRIQATSIQSDLVIARDFSDPVANWDIVKTGTFNSPWGDKTLGCSLGQVAVIDFPAETDPLFEQLIAKAIFAFDQSLWWDIINKNFQINGWNTGWLLPPIIQASDVPNRDAGMDKYSDNMMTTNPAYWTYWYYVPSTDKKGRDTSTYIVYDYSLGSEPDNRNRDQPISNNAANYLFIDTIPTKIVNPNGLFNRVYVFNNFGLKKIEQVT
jgi:hypothetical protein